MSSVYLFFVKRIQDVLGEVESATWRYGNYVTAGSCFSKRMQENQGLWEFEEDFYAGFKPEN